MNEGINILIKNELIREGKMAAKLIIFINFVPNYAKRKIRNKLYVETN